MNKIMKKIEIDCQTGEKTIISLSLAEIAEAEIHAAAQAKENAIKAQRQAAYDAAAIVFESLSVGKQALWEPVRQAVADAIFLGDMEKVKEILVTLPALYPDAEDDRAKFLALFE